MLKMLFSQFEEQYDELGRPNRFLRLLGKETGRCFVKIKGAVQSKYCNELE